MEEHCSPQSIPLAGYLTREFNFETVRKVCIKFAKDKDLTLEEFSQQIFGSYQPGNSTVVIDTWRGLGKFRGQVIGTGCKEYTSKIHLDMLHPSQHMANVAERYVSSYLSPDYVAVMVRMEKALHVNRNATHCFRQTLDMWRKMVRDSGSINTTTFLAADMGRFGSSTYTRATRNKLKKLFPRFFSEIYGHHAAVQEWEETFLAVSEVSSTAYVSVLQKVVAARGKCLLLVGGGSFQQHTLRLYLQGHSGEERCVHIVESCSSGLSVSPDKL